MKKRSEKKSWKKKKKHIRKIRWKQLESREDNGSILWMFSKDEMWNAPFKMCINRKRYF